MGGDAGGIQGHQGTAAPTHMYTHLPVCLTSSLTDAATCIAAGSGNGNRAWRVIEAGTPEANMTGLSWAEETCPACRCDAVLSCLWSTLDLPCEASKGTCNCLLYSCDTTDRPHYYSMRKNSLVPLLAHLPPTCTPAATPQPLVRN